MEAEKPKCSGCGAAMQPFLADEVEVDRCLFCGGLWLDAGELESLTRRTLRADRERKPGVRTCGRGCKGKLHRATVWKFEVDACGECGGIFLDAEELERIAGKPKPLLSLERAAPPVFVKCFHCGDQVEVKAAMAVSGGISCAPCYPIASTVDPQGVARAVSSVPSVNLLGIAQWASSGRPGRLSVFEDASWVALAADSLLAFGESSDDSD